MKTVSKITKSRAGSGSAQPVKLEDFYGLLKKIKPWRPCHVNPESCF